MHRGNNSRYMKKSNDRRRYMKKNLKTTSTIILLGEFLPIFFVYAARISDKRNAACFKKLKDIYHRLTKKRENLISNFSRAGVWHECFGVRVYN